MDFDILLLMSLIRRQQENIVDTTVCNFHPIKVRLILN